MPAGRFVCITLAQPIVIRKLLIYFLKNSEFSYIVRLHLVKLEKSFDMPTFCLVLFKMKKGLKLPTVFETEFGSGSCLKCKDVDKFLSEIEAYQKLYYLSKKVTSLKGESADYAFTDMLDENGAIKYRCFVVNNIHVKKVAYAIFVCPQFDLDSDWLYKTANGRSELVCKHIKEFSRVLIVLLNPIINYGGLECIQKELNNSVMAFAPEGLPPTFKTPFLSTRTDKEPQILVSSEATLKLSEKGSYSVIREQRADSSESEHFTKHLICDRDPFQLQLSLSCTKNEEQLVPIKLSRDMSDMDFVIGLIVANIHTRLPMSSHKFSVSLIGVQSLSLLPFFNQVFGGSMKTVYYETDALLTELVRNSFSMDLNENCCLEVLEQQSELKTALLGDKRMKQDVIVVQHIFLSRKREVSEDDSCDVLLSARETLQQLADLVLPTGCVLLRFQEKTTCDGNGETEETFEQLVKKSKTVFNHVVTVKLKRWPFKLLILSQSSVQSLNLFGCDLKFKNGGFSFDEDHLRNVIGHIKY